MPVGNRKPKKKPTASSKAGTSRKPSKPRQTKPATPEEVTARGAAIIEAGFLAAKADGHVTDGELRDHQDLAEAAKERADASQGAS